MLYNIHIFITIYIFIYNVPTYIYFNDCIMKIIFYDIETKCKRNTQINYLIEKYIDFFFMYV